MKKLFWILALIASTGHFKMASALANEPNPDLQGMTTGTYRNIALSGSHRRAYVFFDVDMAIDIETNRITLFWSLLNGPLTQVFSCPKSGEPCTVMSDPSGLAVSIWIFPDHSFYYQGKSGNTNRVYSRAVTIYSDDAEATKREYDLIHYMNQIGEAGGEPGTY